MLPKKTILISAVLTAFVLSMLGGVAMALRQPVTSAAVEVSTATTVLSAQEAAALAATVFNQQDVYSVENSTVNGVDAYKVVFSSGQVAFVGLDGQVLSITQIPPVVVAQKNVAPAFTTSSGFAPAPAVSQPSGDDHDEHEGGDHDD